MKTIFLFIFATIFSQTKAKVFLVALNKEKVKEGWGLLCILWGSACKSSFQGEISWRTTRHRLRWVDSHSISLKNCAGRLAFLYRQSFLLDQHCRKILCSSLIQPYMDYCCSTWYSALSYNLKCRLDVLQRKMVRFIYRIGPRDHVDNSNLRNLSWLSIPDRVSYFKMMHIFRVRNDLAPSYLRSNFVSLQRSHSHNTRGSDLK